MPGSTAQYTIELLHTAIPQAKCIEGNQASLTESQRKTFLEFEERLNQTIAGRRMIVLCTYPLDGMKGGEVIDVAHAHSTAVWSTAPPAGAVAPILMPETTTFDAKVSVTSRTPLRFAANLYLTLKAPTAAPLLLPPPVAPAKPAKPRAARSAAKV